MTSPQQPQQKPRCRVNWQKPYRAGVICNHVNEQTNECSQEDSSRCPCGGIVRVPAFASHSSAPSREQPVKFAVQKDDDEFIITGFQLRHFQRYDNLDFVCRAILSRKIHHCYDSEMRDRDASISDKARKEGYAAAKAQQPPAPAADALGVLDLLIRFRKAHSKVYGVQTSWEDEGQYILELREAALREGGEREVPK